MGQVGCVACDLADGRLPLPGGLVHQTSSWRIEHCIGPLGVGTLVAKPKRHVTHVTDLTSNEASELGPLLQRVCSVVTELCAPAQVYVCLWSHGPAHVHFVIQPVTGDLMDRLDAHGPKLQVEMFELDEAPDPAQVAAFADEARVAFAKSE